VIEREKLLDNASRLGEWAMSRLANDPKLTPKVANIRGRGLMIGIELKDAPDKIVEKGLERGVILNLTASKVIRLAPPINISRELWEQGLDVVVAALTA
jgi:acetylornithine/succinyldiaminopimelate/putrescine aminotransferase